MSRYRFLRQPRWLALGFLVPAEIDETAGVREQHAADPPVFFAEDAASALDLAFATTSRPAVGADVFRGNGASLRVLVRLGFGQAGEDVSHCRALGRTAAGVPLSLSRSAWSTIRASAGG